METLRYYRIAMREFKERHPGLLRENYTASQLSSIVMRCHELDRAFEQIMIEVKEPVKRPEDGFRKPEDVKKQSNQKDGLWRSET
jgi:hypothetical protein